MDHKRTTRRAAAWLAAAAVAAVATGCSDRSERWTDPLEVTGPYEVDGWALWIDSTRGLAVGLDPSTSPPEIARARLSSAVTFVRATEDDKQLLVLSAGREPKFEGEKREPPQLTVVGVGDEGPRVERSYTLGAPFDRLSVSDNGHWAVAYFGPKDTTGKGGLLRNPSQIAVIDLESDPGEGNPWSRTIRAFGSTPRAVEISPPLSLPQGGSRELALVLADNVLTLIDVAAPKRGEISVQMTRAGSDDKTVRPLEAVFSAGPGKIFVRTDGSDDLYALTLVDKQSDFSVKVDQPSAGSRVLDLLPFADGKKLELLAVLDRGLAVIDIATNQFFTVDLDSSVDTVVGVPRDKPKLALVYSRSRPQRRVHYVDLSSLDDAISARVTSRSLARPVRSLTLVPGDRYALAIHDVARTAVSLLDLESEHKSDAPLQGQVVLETFDFVGKTHIAAAGKGVSRLGIVRLSDLQPRTIELDYRPHRVLAIGERLIVDHGARQGVVTVLPGPEADREDGVVVWGLFSTALLDVEVK